MASYFKMISIFVFMLGFLTTEAHEMEESLNRVSLSVSAEREVENDLLIANLYAEHQAQKQQDVSDHVNKAIRWALEKSKSVNGVKVQTTQYNTFPVYNKQVITGWRARQGIRIESTESTALSDLIGELQAQLLVASINYDVSKQSRDKVEEELTAEALAQFSKRAELIAAELGRDGYQLVQIHVNTQGGRPVPVSYATRGLAAAEAKMASPAIEGGVQSVTVSVNGTVEVNAAP